MTVPDLVDIAASALHALAAAVWVGGMFFAYMIARPSLAVLDPPGPAKFWRRALARFFNWVWVAVAILPVSGLIRTGGDGGFAAAGLHVHLMAGIGAVMIALFAFLYFVRFPAFARAVDEGNFEAARAPLAKIRHLVLVNLILGLITSAIGASGRYWGLG